MKFLEKFKKKKLVQPNLNAHRFKVGGGWGDAINWFGEKPDMVVGWKRKKPKVGDILECEMQSGKMGEFVFEKVDYKHDPPDMFFADVRFVGYTNSGGK